MHKELFGVFGDVSTFEAFRPRSAFDRVVEGASVTVGVRDPWLDAPHLTSTTTDGDDVCVLWGEVFPPLGSAEPAATWFRDRYAARGPAAFAELNGSYLAVVERDGEPVVATDPIRSRECFYADTPAGRVFGTDPVTVARTLPAPSLRPRALLELVHLSVVTGDRTIVRELDRVPFDGYLSPEGTAELDRFVYAPREFDYVDELAARLRRAIDRRASLPGRHGLLLSGGYDSRVVLAGHAGLDRSYTIGPIDGEVVRTAKRLSRQYDTPHRALPIDHRYLPVGPEAVRYGQGIRESIQIHHAGYAAAIDVDTVFHALLFDTLFRGHFLPRDDVEVLGHALPRTRLDPVPDIVETLLTRYGIMPESEAFFPSCGAVDAASVAEFVTEVVDRRTAAWAPRYDSPYNAIELFGIRNQPTTPFRSRLADTHVESFIAADVELLDWHLTTPPEYRNTRTFLAALQQLDGAILRHPPHDRPHRSTAANEVERFLRNRLPFVDAFDPAWPDHETVYERRGLDQSLFPDHPELHPLPSRLKLRLNDVLGWVELVADDGALEPDDVVCPAPEPIRLPSPSRPPAVVPSNE